MIYYIFTRFFRRLVKIKRPPKRSFSLSLYLRDDYPDNKPCEDDPAEDQPYFQGFFFVHGHIYFVSALRTHPVFHFRAAFSAVHGFGIARRIFISFRHTLFPPVFFFRFYCNTILPPPQQNKAARRFFSRKNLIRPLYTVSKNLNFRPYFAIIEARICKREAFADISAPCSNRAKRCYNKSDKKPRYNKIEEKPYAIYPYRQQQHRTACGLL